MENMKNCFYVFEGPSGVGKTTFSTMAEEYLNQNGYKAKRLKTSYTSKEHSLARHIDSILEQPEKYDISSINGISRYMLQTSRDIDVIKKMIRPLLDEGYILLLDRYWWSTYVFGKVDGFDEDLLNPIADIYKAYSKNREPKIIFNIERNSSLKPGVEHWDKFTSAYNYLVQRECKHYNIVNIDNNHDHSIAFQQIINYIMDDLKK